MNEEILFQYQVKTKSQYGTRFYYFYADTDIENYLNNKNIKYVRYAKDTALNKKEKRIRELFKENKQLQQENQSLKQQCEIVEKRLCDEYQDMLEKRNKLFVETSKLKDRIEKAIEYIINNFDFDNDIEKLFEILKGDK